MGPAPRRDDRKTEAYPAYKAELTIKAAVSSVDPDVILVRHIGRRQADRNHLVNPALFRCDGVNLRPYTYKLIGVRLSEWLQTRGCSGN